MQPKRLSFDILAGVHNFSLENEQMALAVLPHLRSDDIVLDLGCGFGLFGCYAAARVKKVFDL